MRERPLDLEWIDFNLGVWFNTYYGHDETYLLDPANRPLYAMQAGKRAQPAAFEQVAKQSLPLVAELRAALRSGAEPDEGDAWIPDPAGLAESGRLRATEEDALDAYRAALRQARD